MTAPSPVFAFGLGAPGVKGSFAAGATVVATLDDTTSVRSVEWDVIGTDETSNVGDYVIVQSGPFGETATTTALVAGTAAILRCRINNGKGVDGNNSPSTTISTAKLYVPLANGGEVGAKDETYESDPVRGTTAILNAGQRAASATSTHLGPSVVPQPAQPAALTGLVSVICMGSPTATVTVNPAFITFANLLSNDINRRDLTIYDVNTAIGVSSKVSVYATSTKTSGSGGSGDWTQLKTAIVVPPQTLAPGHILVAEWNPAGAGIALPDGYWRS